MTRGIEFVSHAWLLLNSAFSANPAVGNIRLTSAFTTFHRGNRMLYVVGEAGVITV